VEITILDIVPKEASALRLEKEWNGWDGFKFATLTITLGAVYTSPPSTQQQIKNGKRNIKQKPECK
jgi:hypothetical protein